MEKFSSELLARKIVMISDYVDPTTYLSDELRNEQMFIDTLRKEIGGAGGFFYYHEIKTLQHLTDTLEKYDSKKTVVFNWCDFLDEREGTAHLVTDYLEKQGYIFTGSGTKCIKTTNNKDEVKKLLLKNRLPTPKYYIAKNERELNDSLSFPVIVKLVDRHGSAGISTENVVYSHKDLVSIAKKLFSDYETEIMVEEFIDGSEYTVTIWGNGDSASCIDINKEDFKDPTISKIFTEKTKFDYSSDEAKNTVSSVVEDEKISKRLSDTALAAYKVLGFSDYGVFEYRQGKDDVYIIDCNPNQFLGLDAIIFEASKKFGLNHGETVLQICEFAVKRNIQ